VIVWFTYCYFVWWLWYGLLQSIRHQPDISDPVENLPFSLIIAAKNEENCIGQVLDRLIDQNYPKNKYEIIIVADRCTDRTVEIVREKKKKFSSLNLLEIKEVPPAISPKKYALEAGIKMARNKILVLMDADCLPGSDYLKTINHYFVAGNQVVINFPKVIINNGYLHNYLLPERLLTWSLAAAGVGQQLPFLAFGGSWGYTREILRKTGGFEKILNSLSGDDDLLIYHMGKLKPPMAACLNSKGWVYTNLPENFKTFFRQRRRHHSAGKHYALPIKIGYAVFHGSNFLLWIFPLVWIPSLILLFLKFFLDSLFLKYAARVFQEEINFKNYVFFEVGYLLHHLIVAPFAFLGTAKWK
jgi:cellulose synthase/poly-beta-1,6-N-acetylglucosamine synthase-like glycosyltransferase